MNRILATTLRFSAATIAILGIVLALTACSDDSTSGSEDSFNVGEEDAHISDTDTGPSQDANGDAPPPEDAGPTVDAEPHEDTGTEDTGAEDTGTEDTGAEDTGPDEPVEDFDPYQTGEFDVVTDELSGGPTDMVVYSPQESGTYPVVVFQHGFLMANTHYSQMLTHLASHGFVVAAPQMYEAGGLPIGTPSTEEEAQLANEVYDWLADHLDDAIDADVDVTRLGLAGHSRGAKAIWWALGEESRDVDAVAGIDPVDGTGGPLGGEPQVLDDPVDIDAPVLSLGAELGSESAGIGQPACAPEGENYEEFFAASTSPAWQVLAHDYGHMDMLDDNPQGCGLECDACVDGDSRAPMRQLSAGLSVALFRAALHDQPEVLDWLEDEQAAPINISVEAK